MNYLAIYQYAPNTASTNRVMAYIKALSELGVQTCVVFFMPNKAHEKMAEKYPNTEVKYLWDSWYIDIPRINTISLRFYIRRFIQSLKPEDTVYVYGFVDLVVALSRMQSLKVFAECTENPEAAFVPRLRGTTVSKYLQACSSITGMVVISEGLKNYFISRGCKKDKTFVVNMIVDTTRFGGLQKQSSESYIAYCGTASNTKDGVDQLIKAYGVAVKRHPDYKLYIIGSTLSKQQSFDNLELVKELGIEDKVVFTGIVSSEKIPQLLKNASILALDRPNNLQAQYGFPTKLGEYLLTNNPVVITKVGDIPLFLKDMESALIAQPENPEDFADKLCWAIEHPVEAAVIGCNGRAVAEKQFNYLTETRKIISLINTNK